MSASVCVNNDTHFCFFFVRLEVLFYFFNTRWVKITMNRFLILLFVTSAVAEFSITELSNGSSVNGTLFASSSVEAEERQMNIYSIKISEQTTILSINFYDTSGCVISFTNISHFS